MDDGTPQGIQPHDDPKNAVELGAVAAAAGGRAFASFLARTGPDFIAKLRREPFLYNVYFSGVMGGYQAAGLRITNPHPDVIYLRNPALKGSAAHRLTIRCVLRGNHEQAKPYEPGPQHGMGFADVPWIREGELTKAGLAADQLPLMDQNGLPIAPLGQIDLCFYFAAKGPEKGFEGDPVTLDLAAEGYRTKFTTTTVTFLLRNWPLL